MLRYTTTGLAALVIMLVLDSLWIGLVALPQFRTALGDLLLFRPVPGVLFYLIYLAGILVFAATPAFASGSWTTAAGLGALLGLCAYATYDFTNLATLRPWSWGLALKDLVWGTFLTSVAAGGGVAIGEAVYRWLRPAG